MKIQHALTMLSLFSSQLKADEIKCTSYARNTSLRSIEKLATDCALQKSLAKDENVQKHHREIIYEKLSKELAKQITQNSEDISLLTNFYNTNDQDLMMNSKEIADSCRLDTVKSIETCGGNTSGPYYNFKLSLLKSKLPSNSNTPFKNEQSLFGILAGKFYSDLGMNESGNDLKCPLVGNSGNFMLRNQLEDESSEDIVNLIKNSKESVFEQYAHLKLVQNTNDPQFVEKFKNYIKAIPAGAISKDYVKKFFFDKENQKKMAPALANQCKKMNKNMNQFLCSDLTELGSLDDKTSINLFNKLNTTDSIEDQYEVDFSDSSVLTAYGMQCIAKENLLMNSDEKKSANFQSIDQWYSDFTKNIRDEEGISRGQTSVDDFCLAYTCKDKKTQSLKSCKSGGPLNSRELSTFLGCEESPKKEDCNSRLQKNISYMASLEKLKQNSVDQVIAQTSKSSTTSSTASNLNENEDPKTVVKGRLPNFAENYLGVEGSLKALGKPVTSTEIAQKKQEFSDNKLATTSPTYATPGAMKNELAKIQKARPKIMEQETSGTQPTYAPTVATQTPVSAPSFIMPKERSVTTSNKAKVNNNRLSGSESENRDSKLRDEVEKMIADIKNTKKEMSEVQNTITSRPKSYAQSSSGPTEALPVNRGDQERLRRLEQSLNDKSNRLEEYRRELDNRNFATRSGLANDRSASRSSTNDNQNLIPNEVNSANDASNNSNSGSGVKLAASTNTKIDLKPPLNNYAAALIQSGVESSSLTAEELAKLSAEKLKGLGIDSSQPFTLRVNFEGQTYQVPVKAFIFKGTKALGPIMDPKNKNLNDFLLSSPLFKHYLNYLYEKDKKSALR